MATDSSRNARFAPKRGKIKAQIFESMVKKVVSVFSDAGVAPRENKEETGKGGGSASVSPPPSAYSSDGNTDIS
ncbi:hypothetical protein HS088_TW02G00523 [Tripterygium wilfordii]|uniref:Uncharacterized protein n=1 Tax=Tripterygium wilfordii TaxID=458696 RepID=A0A7J7DZ08_TRIWF|nr:hypothetical protein HS088_TW02G00523 [Tripterygium wilfordii]